MLLGLGETELSCAQNGGDRLTCTFDSYADFSLVPIILARSVLFQTFPLEGEMGHSGSGMERLPGSLQHCPCPTLSISEVLCFIIKSVRMLQTLL